MPNHTYKSAAVPFVNQKGERSMKRVKVERYVAGKKPGYAKDEDEEYYTTDDELEGEESGGDEEEDGSYAGEDNDEQDDRDEESPRRKVVAPKEEEEVKTEIKKEDDEDDSDEDDDPRFRRLKQVESMASTSSRLSYLQNRGQVEKVEENRVGLVVEDEEDEEEIRQRHALAKARVLEEPIGPQAVLGEFTEQVELIQSTSSGLDKKREETEDILKDLKLTGIKPKQSKIKDSLQMDENIKDMIEQAKQEAIFTAQVHKKIEEDNKKELELEARVKNDFGASDMNAVNTDDEDEEFAYEEWKLREIKRVQRDRLERAAELAKVR